MDPETMRTLFCTSGQSGDLIGERLEGFSRERCYDGFAPALQQKAAMRAAAGLLNRTPCRDLTRTASCLLDNDELFAVTAHSQALAT